MAKWKWSLNTNLENCSLLLIQRSCMIFCKSFFFSVLHHCLWSIIIQIIATLIHFYVLYITWFLFFLENLEKIATLSHKRIIINPYPIKYMRKILNSILVRKIHLISQKTAWNFPCGPYATSDVDRAYTEEKQPCP